MPYILEFIDTADRYENIGNVEYMDVTVLPDTLVVGLGDRRRTARKNIRIPPTEALRLARAIIAAYDAAPGLTEPPPATQGNAPNYDPPFYLVWSPAGLRPPQFRHSSRELADAEAMRLANTRAGGDFYTLVPVSRTTLPASAVREDYAYSTSDRPF